MPRAAARRDIASVTALREVKAIRDKRAAVISYAKARGYKLSQINDLVEDNVRDERHCGRFLREIERSAGERTDVTSPHSEARLTPYQQALQEAGLSKPTAERWQIMSFVPESALTAYVVRSRGRQGETNRKNL